MPKNEKSGKKITAADKKATGTEIGRTGTSNFSGIIQEEYLGKLAGTRAMRTYDEMRRSDATVDAGIQAVTLPIRRANWYVEPASEDKQDVEMAEFVQNNLMEYMTITWDDFLRQALLNIVFGVSIFEKVFEIKTIDGKDMICWRKFSPRMPSTITAWQLKNKEDGVIQNTTEGGEVEIPMDKLLVFCNDKEGDNWWGISKLRKAYKPWYIKSNLEKIDAIAHERQGLGLPSVKLGENASPEEIAKATTVLSAMSAHEEGYLIQPANMNVEFMDMKASGTKDAARAIGYHDRQILKAFLAQFINLGSDASGSRALSEDQTTLFLQSIEAIADGIKDVINKYGIKQLIDMNWDGVSKYPKLQHSGIAREDIDKLSTTYQRLTQSGGLKAEDGDNAYWRKKLGLPEANEEEEPAKEEKEEIEETAKDLGLPEDAKKKVENAETIRKAISLRVLSIPTNDERIEYLREKIGQASRFAEKNPRWKTVVRVLHGSLRELNGHSFREENDFKGWRELRFSEKKVSLSRIQDFINKGEAAFIDEANAALKETGEEFLNRLTVAVQSGDMQKVRDLEMSHYNDYKAVIRASIDKAFDFGKNNASNEMAVKTPGNPTGLAQQLDVIADTIATMHHYKIESEAKLAITNQLTKFSEKFGEKEIAALSAAASIIASTTGSIVEDTAAIIIASSINKGRALVFDKNVDKIYALQRSEILDEATCNFCLSIDGRVVKPDDSIAKESVFHSNCRGIWVEILKDEEELPDIKGVPQSIRDRIGDSVNEIVQPKTPIVKKESLAAQAIAKKKDKKASEKADDPSQFGECGGRPHRHGFDK
jgi:hypothetical protein